MGLGLACRFCEDVLYAAGEADVRCRPEFWSLLQVCLGGADGLNRKYAVHLLRLAVGDSRVETSGAAAAKSGVDSLTATSRKGRAIETKEKNRKRGRRRGKAGKAGAAVLDHAAWAAQYWQVILGPWYCGVSCVSKAS